MLGVLSGKFSIILIVQCSKSDGCSNETNKKPVVAALLDLHKGENCETLNLHGIQQLAALESSLKEINLDLLSGKVELNLQVFDTCSTQKGTRTATLKALVAAEQTCLHAPFFLGFIGNENRANFEVSQAISNVFKMAQVLPYSFPWGSEPMDDVHFISSYSVKQHSEAVKIILAKLRLQNVIIVHENTLISKMKADHLIDNSSNDVCFLKSVEFLNVDDIKAQLEQGSNEDAILIMIENVNILDYMSEFLMKYMKQIIISSGKVGFQNSLFPVIKPTYVLQFISSIPFGNLSQNYNEELIKLYNNQQLLKCSKKMDKIERKCNSSVIPATHIRDKDWTVDLLQYGLRLYGYSIGIAAYKKCKQIDGSQGLCSQFYSLPQKEWNNILRESSVLIQTKPGSTSEKINFNMNIHGKFAIYVFEKGYIQKVGQIEGPSLELYDNYKFLPPLPRTGISTKCLETVPGTISVTQLPSNSSHTEAPMVLVSGFFDLDIIRDYELIGVLSGIVFGVVFLLSLFVYAVYTTVKVKSIHSNGSSRGSVHSRTSE